ncbi:UMP-CMP kinase [Salix suchowensis]|nr:UMP-CMP kinase [Salix suchowensis]
MERRILSRNEGRVDDNIETIRKRFKVFQESSLPVVEYYDSKGKVRKIDAAKPVEEVFEAVKAIITPKEKVDAAKPVEVFEVVKSINTPKEEKVAV